MPTTTNARIVKLPGIRRPPAQELTLQKASEIFRKQLKVLAVNSCLSPKISPKVAEVIIPGFNGDTQSAFIQPDLVNIYVLAHADRLMKHGKMVLIADLKLAPTRQENRKARELGLKKLRFPSPSERKELPLKNLEPGHPGIISRFLDRLHELKDRFGRIAGF